jgi:hypothetical protein
MCSILKSFLISGEPTAVPATNPMVSNQASSSLLLAFASMVILGVEPHREP